MCGGIKTIIVILSVRIAVCHVTSQCHAPLTIISMRSEPCPEHLSDPNLDDHFLDELSTDDSEREDEFYVAQTAHYGNLIRHALRTFPIPDDEGVGEAACSDHIQDTRHNGGSQSGVFASSSVPAATRIADLTVPEKTRPSSATARIFLSGFAPSITPNDVISCMSTYGPVARFRLFCDPSSGVSLRAATVVFEDAANASDALKAAVESTLYLANVWAPEASLVADPNGELAIRAYHSHVGPHAPLPALLEMPRSSRHAERDRMRDRDRMRGSWAAAGATPSEKQETVGQQARALPAAQHVAQQQAAQQGAAQRHAVHAAAAQAAAAQVAAQAQRASAQQAAAQQAAAAQAARAQAQQQAQAAAVASISKGSRSQLVVSGLPPHATPQSVKVNFGQFGRMRNFAGTPLCGDPLQLGKVPALLLLASPTPHQASLPHPWLLPDAFSSPRRSSHRLLRSASPSHHWRPPPHRHGRVR